MEPWLACEGHVGCIWGRRVGLGVHGQGSGKWVTWARVVVSGDTWDHLGWQWHVEKGPGCVHRNGAHPEEQSMSWMVMGLWLGLEHVRGVWNASGMAAAH